MKNFIKCGVLSALFCCCMPCCFSYDADAPYNSEGCYVFRYNVFKDTVSFSCVCVHPQGRSEVHHLASFREINDKIRIPINFYAYTNDFVLVKQYVFDQNGYLSKVLDKDSHEITEYRPIAYNVPRRFPELQNIHYIERAFFYSKVQQQHVVLPGIQETVEGRGVGFDPSWTYNQTYRRE